MSAISAASPPTRSSSHPAPSCAPRSPIRRGSIPIPLVSTSAWWRGSRRTIAWCWSDERPPHLHASGAARGHRALSLDGPVLPGAVRFRAEDQPLADRDRATALSAGVQPFRRLGRDQGGIFRALARQFPL